MNRDENMELPVTKRERIVGVTFLFNDSGLHTMSECTATRREGVIITGVGTKL